jgi:WD40 repeat protein
VRIKFNIFLILFLATGLVLSAQNDDNLVHIFKKHNKPVLSVSFSRDSKLLASGAEDKAIYIWDVNSFELIYSIEDNYFPIRALQFAQENQILAACGPDIKLMSFEGDLLKTFSGNTTHIWSFDFNAETDKIVSGSYAKRIRVWNYTSGETLFTLEGHEKSTLPVCFSHDGKYIISGSLDRTVRIWNAVTGTEIRNMDKHSENIFSVKFHPGGKYIASASGDKTIRLWDFSTGEIVKSYIGHNKEVMDIDFSPDGNHLVSCSYDNTIILWETISGNKIYSFTDHEGFVNCVRYSPDGEYIASASDDKSVRLWKLNKRIFIDYYFSEEIENEISESSLLLPKKKSESKTDYKIRLEKEKIALDKIIDNYYNKYLDILDKQEF